MNNFESLVEAMSRRDFLKPIKKSNKEPETPVSSKTSTKKPKKITRRDFIKKTGVGSAIGALNPVDKVLQSLPNIMSYVASAISWEDVLNKNLLLLVRCVSLMAQSSEEGEVFAKQNDLIMGSSSGSDTTWFNNAFVWPLKNITKAFKHLIPTEKNIIHRSEKIANLFDKIVNDKEWNEKNRYRYEDYMYSEGAHLEHIRRLIKYAINNNLLDIKTAKSILDTPYGSNYYPEVQEFVEKSKKKNTNKTYKNDEIDYSRMDKAGGAEDVGYAKYYEHMNTFDNLVNNILQEKKDRCYNRAVQAYGTKTSAYRSAAMVKCRKGKIWKKKK